MRQDIWEDFISLNSASQSIFEPIQPVAAYPRDKSGFNTGLDEEVIAKAIEGDPYPLPATKDREGYYGDKHFDYWASGLRDWNHLKELAKGQQVEICRYLDIGCASGRMLRHVATQDPEVEVYGTDINRKHIDWINEYLPESIIAIQNHSVPHLPFPDNYFDLISAYSVFTHIESFDTTWLMELRRILKPNGLAWITAHTEKTLEEMNENWPLYKGLANHPDFKNMVRDAKSDSPKESPWGRLNNLRGRSNPEDTDDAAPEQRELNNRLIFRWHAERSYSSNVFYSLNYITKNWARVMPIIEVRRRFPAFQDVVIFQKGA